MSRHENAKLWPRNPLLGEERLTSLWLATAPFTMPYLSVSGQEDEIQSLELFAGKQAICRQTQKFGF